MKTLTPLTKKELYRLRKECTINENDNMMPAPNAGTFLGRLNGKIIATNAEAKNNNVMFIAPAGEGKTCFAKEQMEFAIKQKHSVLVLDSQDSARTMLANTFAANGYSLDFIIKREFGKSVFESEITSPLLNLTSIILPEGSFKMDVFIAVTSLFTDIYGKQNEEAFGALTRALFLHELWMSLKEYRAFSFCNIGKQLENFTEKEFKNILLDEPQFEHCENKNIVVSSIEYWKDYEQSDKLGVHYMAMKKLFNNSSWKYINPNMDTDFNIHKNLMNGKIPFAIFIPACPEFISKEGHKFYSFILGTILSEISYQYEGERKFNIIIDSAQEMSTCMSRPIIRLMKQSKQEKISVSLMFCSAAEPRLLFKENYEKALNRIPFYIYKAQAIKHSELLDSALRHPHVVLGHKELNTKMTTDAMYSIQKSEGIFVMRRSNTIAILD